MTTWCIDANVVMATLLREDSTQAALRFWAELNQEDEVIAPHILFPECTSALRKRMLDGTLTEAEGLQLMEEMLGMPIAIEASTEQFGLALRWAVQAKRRKTNDLQYVAVAEIRNAQIITLDAGVRQAAVEHQIPVRVIQ